LTGLLPSQQVIFQQPTQREYKISANLINPGKHVIAIRVWDCFGGGRLINRDASALLLQPPRVVVEVPAKAPGFYHADYRKNCQRGDEPYCYYNW
jgi:hypothetical protein